MTTMLISAPREISSQMLFSNSILLMAATPKVAAKKVRPLVRMDWLQCSSACWAAVSYTHLDVYKRQDLYEAATIDGAGKWRQFFSITVPMITPIIFYNLVTQICQAFQEFNGPYIITNGGPRGSTTLISLLVYNYAFKSYDLSLIHISGQVWGPGAAGSAQRCRPGPR